jgi:hypothetical protein
MNHWLPMYVWGRHIYHLNMYYIHMVFFWFQHTNMKYVFKFISYLLNNHLSSFQLRQNSMAHLNECVLLNIKKTQQCLIWKLNPNFLFYLHQSMVTNEHQYVIKMESCATMIGLWGDFIIIFWIAEYLQKPI